jgi:hypothetical protein
MFVFERVENPVSIPGINMTWREYAIDHERGYGYYPVAGRLRGSGLAQILVTGRDLIPFETSFENPLDDSGLRTVTEFIEAFGHSRQIEKLKGVGPYEFKSEQQKQELLKVAAEAVLVFTCNTIEAFIRDEGRVKVQARGHVWTRKSFGLPTSD